MQYQSTTYSVKHFNFNFIEYLNKVTHFDIIAFYLSKNWRVAMCKLVYSPARFARV